MKKAKSTQVAKVIHPDRAETRYPAKGGKFSLDELQGMVGGNIELVHLEPGQGLGHTTAYVNEEGKLHGLPRNDRATGMVRLYQDDYVVGPLVIIRRESL